MKLGWLLTIIGGGYFVFRLIQIWYYWPLFNSPWGDAGFIFGQALVIGGIPLFFGIRRLKQQYARKRARAITTTPMRAHQI